jgi:hypothetical protein
VTKFSQPRFSVPGSGSEEHNRIFGPPPPGSQAARRQGCTCRDATSTSLGCPVHPLDYLPPTKRD